MPDPAALEVRVGASTTPGEALLPSMVAAFSAAHPSVAVRLSVQGTAAVLRDLEEGRVDLAVVGARGLQAALHFEDLAEDEIVLVAAPGAPGLPAGPLSLTECARLPRVEREAASATRAIVESQLAAMGAPLDPGAVVLTTGSLQEQRRAVVEGLGAGWLSHRAVAAELAQGRLRILPVAAVLVPRRYYVAWRIGTPFTPAARAFLAAARATVAGWSR